MESEEVESLIESMGFEASQRDCYYVKSDRAG